MLHWSICCTPFGVACQANWPGTGAPGRSCIDGYRSNSGQFPESQLVKLSDMVPRDAQDRRPRLLAVSSSIHGPRRRTGYAIIPALLHMRQRIFGASQPNLNLCPRYPHKFGGFLYVEESKVVKTGCILTGLGGQPVAEGLSIIAGPPSPAGIRVQVPGLKKWLCVSSA